jgi:hypothetical protein
MRWSDVLPEMTGGLCDAADRTALIERAVAFLAAGFRVPAPQFAVPFAVPMERNG